MKTHVPLDPFTAQQLAASAIARARALDELKRHDRFEISWRLIGLVLAGGLWGWGISLVAVNGPLLVGIAAGAAFFTSLGAYQAATRSKRRLDAAVVLLTTPSPKTWGPDSSDLPTRSPTTALSGSRENFATPLKFRLSAAKRRSATPALTLSATVSRLRK